MNDIYTFPAIFSYEPDGIAIEFPDLPGCLSCADNNDEAVFMATDALSLRLYSDECDGSPIPEPSNVLELKKHLAENEVVTLIRLSMPAVRAKFNERSISKTVTLPAWLLHDGREADINFSQTLQDALMEKLGIHRKIKRRRPKPKYTGLKKKSDILAASAD